MSPHKKIFFLLLILFALLLSIPRQVSGQADTGTCLLDPNTCKVTDKCKEGFKPQANTTPSRQTGLCLSGCRCVSETAAAGYEPTRCKENTPQEGIQTALGCIPTANTTEFIAWFLRWAIGIAGGIAFLLILFAGFQIITSSGDPEKLKAGRELLTSAIAGLILIIFSVFLLRLIGVEILRIPGF